MIVWLASYPRSGNTLLRQVIKQCLGRDSYEQPGGAAARPDEDAAWGEIRAAYGNLFSCQSRDAFLSTARESAEAVLVKTHELPDGEPDRAIYVVRDGRLALQSFVKYQDTYQPGASSFASLLVGDHAYRDWTTHYRLWCEGRQGPLLVLRFEDLVEATPDLVRRLADFIGHEGEVRPWVNPQRKLRELSSAFFGSGAASWRPDAFWTPARLRQFSVLHGELSRQLGYADVPCPEDADEAEALRHAAGVAAQRWRLQAVCDERALVMELLREACDKQTAEIELLREACAERLALIERLDAAARSLAAERQRAAADHADEVARLREELALLRHEGEQLRPMHEAMKAWRLARAWLPLRAS